MSYPENIPFKLFATCKLTDGKNFSTISDLENQGIQPIPNSLLKVLQENQGMSISEIKKLYTPEESKILDSYFSFLFENDYIFFTSSPEQFPEIEETWYTPEVIVSAIIDFRNEPSYDIIKVLNELSLLQCKHIQLRYFEIEDLKAVERIMKSLEGSTIISVDVLMPHKDSITFKDLSTLFKYPRLSGITVFNAENEESKSVEGKIATIDYSVAHINNCSSCGKIDQKYFTATLDFYTESKNFNTCLNRKISIDENGMIKNCPSMMESFGHASNTNLLNVILQGEFLKYWHVRKEEIKKCNECAFRNTCSDCRAYLEDPTDIYSAPLKCGFNPESQNWDNWLNDPEKQQAIAYYKL
ncbi:MAG: grasp-with-spasm system SPASM domain peptide maturase [Sphingobacterium sp.]|jgi:SPASM domain peptide maturase of grasp-with-spasm system|uniref:grasp-with-spasm system SPASM domain peptide maturase n=1 Tax=Sphingobacterium sp. TaxID=341027 RepID=UPI0028504E68|nr:grasp-with-spasm system SPASM domain peptide maturase [Sphingobacterium sp.]MDR3008605.1 grasp-with-spasm system SPASM domain peptide maturase [Sphingobacterium sp.]